MSMNDMISKIEALKEWEALAAEAAAEIEALKDSIKAELNARGVEELEAGSHIVRFTTVVSNRLDTTALKKSMPEVYEGFLKTSTSKRFTVA